MQNRNWRYIQNAAATLIWCILVTISTANARDISVTDHGAICDGNLHILGKSPNKKVHPNYIYEKRDKDKTVDWAGIQSAINAATPIDRIVFPDGADCVLNHFVLATGTHHFTANKKARIHLAANSKTFHAVIFKAASKAAAPQSVIWNNIDLDGNQLHQHHPLNDRSTFISIAQGGTKSTNRKLWNQRSVFGNCGTMCMIGPYDRVTVSNMRVDNAVGDGVVTINVENTSFTNVQSSGNAPFNYSRMKTVFGFGLQGTAFKCRTQQPIPDNAKYRCRITNADVTGGSIAFQFSTPPQQQITNTSFELQNVHCNDMVQNCVHVEHAQNISIHGLYGKCAQTINCKLDLFIGTQALKANLSNIGTPDNPLKAIDLRNASRIKTCTADSVHLERHDGNRPAIRRCHTVRNAAIQTPHIGIQAQNIYNATITGVTSTATLQPSIIENSNIHCHDGAQGATAWRNPRGTTGPNGSRHLRIANTAIANCDQLGNSVDKITDMELRDLVIEKSGPILLSRNLKNLTASNLRIIAPTGPSVFICPAGFRPEQIQIHELHIVDHKDRPLNIPLGCNNLTKTDREKQD